MFYFEPTPLPPQFLFCFLRLSFYIFERDQTARRQFVSSTDHYRLLSISEFCLSSAKHRLFFQKQQLQCFGWSCRFVAAPQNLTQSLSKGQNKAVKRNAIWFLKLCRLCFYGYLEVILMLASVCSSSMTESGANKQTLDSGRQTEIFKDISNKSKMVAGTNSTYTFHQKVVQMVLENVL